MRYLNETVEEYKLEERFAFRTGLSLRIGPVLTLCGYLPLMWTDSKSR